MVIEYTEGVTQDQSMVLKDGAPISVAEVVVDLQALQLLVIHYRARVEGRDEED